MRVAMVGTNLLLINNKYLVLKLLTFSKYNIGIKLNHK